MDVKKAATLSSVIVMASMLSGGFFIQVCMIPIYSSRLHLQYCNAYDQTLIFDYNLVAESTSIYVMGTIHVVYISYIQAVAQDSIRLRWLRGRGWNIPIQFM